MNENYVPSISELIAKYLDDSLTEQEAERLLHTIEKNEGASRMLTSCMLSHLFLTKRFKDIREQQQEYGTGTSVYHDIEAKIKKKITIEDAFEVPLSWEPHPLNHSNTKNFCPDKSETVAKEFDPFAIYDTPAKEKSLNPIVTKHQRLWPFITTLFLFFGIIGLAEWNTYRGFPSLARDVASNDFVPIGTITNLINVVWSEDSESYKAGQKVEAGNISFKSGIMNLVMNNGTELLITGPADFSTFTNGNIFARKGCISARVPTLGHGFMINTPWANVIDRGTEFMIDIDEKNAEVYVIKGRVELQSLNSQQQIKLTAGQASQIDKISVDPPRKAVPKAYLSYEQFQKVCYNDQTKKLLRQQEHDRIIDVNPSLLCRFKMSDMSNNQVVNSALLGKNICSHLTLHHCEFVEGMLKQTGTVKFGVQQSYGELSVDGQYQSLTLAMSIRIEQLHNNGNVFMVSSDYFKKTGGILWQVSSIGQLLFHITIDNSGRCETFSSPALFKKKFCGGWYNFAVVIDGKNKRISHYLDGRKIAHVPWNQPIPLKIGKAFIGNYTDLNRTINSRFLSGNMDRVYIFNRALTSQEMMNLNIVQ